MERIERLKTALAARGSACLLSRCLFYALFLALPAFAAQPVLAVLPAGCPAGFEVKQDGSLDYPAIQPAVNALPPNMSTDTCVVIRDTETYSEQVTVQGFTTNGYRLKIMADPTFVSSMPIISPPMSSTAAFHVMNDSVTIQGFNFQSALVVYYGILSSSASVEISDVNMNGGAMISEAAISIATRSLVTDSFATADGAHGLKITGSENTVSYSTMTSALSMKYGLYLTYANNNDIFRSFVYNPNGDGAYLNFSDYNHISSCTIRGDAIGRSALSLYSGSDNNVIANTEVKSADGWGMLIANGSSFNTVRDSTVTTSGTASSAFDIYASAVWNVVQDSFISNSAGRAASIRNYSMSNTIIRSTMTTGGGGAFPAVLFETASPPNTIVDSYIQGSTAVYVSGSTGTVIGGSLIVATASDGAALKMSGGSKDMIVATTTFSAGGAGAAVYLAPGNSGIIELGSNTVTGGAYGLNIGALPGVTLKISSITFAALSPGATAINFLPGGYYITDITSAAFNSADIGVNVNGSGLSAGSMIMMRGATGPRWGALYESDPGSYVFWDTIRALLVAPADGALEISQAPGLHVRAQDAEMPVQYYYQVDIVPAMDSQGGSPLFSFDQWASQVFGPTGAFSGQDSTTTFSGDSYLHTSTATFVFYSTGTRLGPASTYYWRVKAKTPQTGEYGNWTSVRAFTTGKAAIESPLNNIDISNISLSSATGLSSRINFSIRENNVSTGTTPNGANYNTADWLFVKFSTAAGADGTWNHATLAPGGGVGAGGILAVSSDRKGAFIDHTDTYSMWQSTATLIWNYYADGVRGGNAIVKVFALSMVNVPTGSFVYNAGGIGGSTYNNYGGGAQASVTSANDTPSGAAAGWPNGYDGFYIMRYEITQGQYADFLNTVHSSTATARYASDVGYGHDMPYNGGNPYGSRYSATDRFAAKNYLSTADLWSYLSWAALRPITEMEFEKAGRDISPDSRIYPWGDASPDTATYSPPNEGGTHTRNFLNYNDALGGKVLDSGRYMSGDVYRTAEQTGSSPYGLGDLSGNVWEHAINCSYLSIPENGNGTVAWPTNWPSIDSTEKAQRGGAWGDAWHDARISARAHAQWSDTNRVSGVGGRGVRVP